MNWRHSVKTLAPRFGAALLVAWVFHPGPVFAQDPVCGTPAFPCPAPNVCDTTNNVCELVITPPATGGECGSMVCGSGGEAVCACPAGKDCREVWCFRAPCPLLCIDSGSPLGNPGGTGGTGNGSYKVEYLHTDALGSVRMVTDQAGAVVSRSDYYPFGGKVDASFNDRASIGGYTADPNARQRFTGKERDGESGLDYYGARYYSSAQGRFTTPDAPFADQYEEDPQSWNLYSYTRNNPLKYVDDDGRALKLIVSGFKLLVKGGDVASTFAGVTEAVAIIASGNPAVGTGARLLAVGSLLGEVSGVSDVLKGGKAALKVVDSVNDAKKVVNAADNAADATRASSRYKPGGDFSETTKRAAAEKAGNKCEYCTVDTVPGEQSRRGVTPPGNQGQTDHFIPKAKGGTNDPTNARHSCRDCNIKKADKLPNER